MKKFFTIFFVTLGVIFAVILIFALCFFLINKMTGKTVIFSGEGGSIIEVQDGVPAGSEGTDAHPLLSASQEAALRAFGIDPATVPTEITADQEACFTAALGASRVAEIKAGAVPSASEFFTAKAQGCL